MKIRHPHGKDKLQILLVEDDPQLCRDLGTYINTLNDTKLIGATKSSYEAIDLICAMQPDALILCLELPQGSGNGLLLLSDLHQLPAEARPYTLVTTNNSSPITLDLAHKLGADMIMSKHKTDYTARSPVDFLRSVFNSLRISSGSGSEASSNSLFQKQQKVKSESLFRAHITEELDALGFSNKLLGYQYLIDAICLAHEKSRRNISRELAHIYQKTSSSVERAMQNSIEKVWNTVPPEILNIRYTAHVNPDRGMPTIMEFISFYLAQIDNS